MDFFIVNTHSTLNAGDAGIVLGEIDFLKRYFHDVRIALTSRTPKLDRILYHPLGIDVFPPIIPAPSAFSYNVQGVRQSLLQLLGINHTSRMLSRMKKCDAFLSNGGGYFWSNRSLLPGPMFFQNYLHVKLASILGKPILFLPQSVGPFNNTAGPKLLKNVLGKDNVIKVLTREMASFDFLSKLLKGSEDKAKVGFCHDMAFLLPTETAEIDRDMKITLPAPRLAITVREWHFPATAKNIREQKRMAYFYACKEVCRKVFTKLGGSILIFPQARGPGAFENDFHLSWHLFHELKKDIPHTHLSFAELPMTVSPLHIIKLLSQVDLILATRFHSAIFALLSGVPPIAIGYQPKSKGVMELLDLQDFYIDIGEMDPMKIIGMMKSILRDRDTLSRHILMKVDQVREETEKELRSCFKRFL